MTTKATAPTKSCDFRPAALVQHFCLAKACRCSNPNQNSCWTLHYNWQEKYIRVHRSFCFLCLLIDLFWRNVWERSISWQTFCALRNLLLRALSTAASFLSVSLAVRSHRAQMCGGFGQSLPWHHGMQCSQQPSVANKNLFVLFPSCCF